MKKKMSKERMKGIVLGVIIGAVVSSVAAVGAASTTQGINALLNFGLKFKVNAEEWKPEQHPISYNNTTYLPLREVGSALNVAVDFDPETQTILLGEKSDKTPIFSKNYELNVDAYYTKDPEQTVFDGLSYGEGVVDNPVTGYSRRFHTFYPNGAYQKMVLAVGVTGERDVVVTIKDGDIVLKRQVISTDDEITPVEADIGGVEEVKVYVQAPDNYQGQTSAFIAGGLESYYK